jgi:alpha-L-rhamnosidase
LIASEWRKSADFQKNTIRFDWQIEVPPNTTATAYVPAMHHRIVTEGGRPIGSARGVKLVRPEGDRIVLQLGSGKYHLVSE